MIVIPLSKKGLIEQSYGQSPFQGRGVAPTALIVCMAYFLAFHTLCLCNGVSENYYIKAAGATTSRCLGSNTHSPRQTTVGL